MNDEIRPPLVQQGEEQEELGRLSFCDLPISGAATPDRPTAPSDHLFEFSAALHSPFYNDIIFCGKIIHADDIAAVKIKSKSVHNPAFFRNGAASENRRPLSASTRFSGGGDPVYHAQGVNITSLTSMSAKSRRRMFMFGPVKFKPEMELASIKQRQMKIAAAPLKASAPSGGKSHWGVLKSSLRGRSHLSRVLAKSLGCIPVASRGGGMERWVGVAS